MKIVIHFAPNFNLLTSLDRRPSCHLIHLPGHFHLNHRHYLRHYHLNSNSKFKPILTPPNLNDLDHHYLNFFISSITFLTRKRFFNLISNPEISIDDLNPHLILASICNFLRWLYRDSALELFWRRNNFLTWFFPV